MEIVQLARAAGKTTKVVELATKKHYDILVFNHDEKERLLATYPNLDNDQVYTADELLAGRRRGLNKYKHTVIDNAELVLHRMVPSAQLMTITDYNKEEK